MVYSIIKIAAIIFTFIFFIVGVRIGYLYLRKRDKFNEEKYVAEFGMIFFTALIALITVYQANESIEKSTEDFNNLFEKIDTLIGDLSKSKETLEQVEQKLSKLPGQLDDFSQSIISLNDVMKEQKVQFLTTISSLNESIETFRITVDSLRSRFDRKPNLKIEYSHYQTDSTYVITQFVITNWGDLIAELYMLRLSLPNQITLSVKMDDLIKDREYPNFTTYQRNFLQTQIIPASRLKPLIVECTIVFKKHLVKEFSFTLSAYYKAELGNSGFRDIQFELFQKARGN